MFRISADQLKFGLNSLGDLGNIADSSRLAAGTED